MRHRVPFMRCSYLRLTVPSQRRLAVGGPAPCTPHEPGRQSSSEHRHEAGNSSSRAVQCSVPRPVPTAATRRVARHRDGQPSLADRATPSTVSTNIVNRRRPVMRVDRSGLVLVGAEGGVELVEAHPVFGAGYAVKASSTGAGLSLQARNVRSFVPSRAGAAPRARESSPACPACHAWT